MRITATPLWCANSRFPVYASYHMYRRDWIRRLRLVSFDNPRTELPAELGPGQAATLALRITAPARARRLCREHQSCPRARELVRPTGPRAGGKFRSGCADRAHVVTRCSTRIARSRSSCSPRSLRSTPTLHNHDVQARLMSARSNSANGRASLTVIFNRKVVEAGNALHMQQATHVK